MQYVPASAGFMTVLQQLRTCIETPKTNEWNKEHNINLTLQYLSGMDALPDGKGGFPALARPAPQI